VQPPGQAVVAAHCEQVGPLPRRLDHGAHARQLVVQHLVIGAHFQQLRVGHHQHVGDVGFALRLQDEGAVPGDHGEVGVIREALAQQVGAGARRERPLLPRQQRDEIDTLLQQIGGHGLVEGVHDGE
jgi:hypothetical protein